MLKTFVFASCLLFKQIHMNSVLLRIELIMLTSVLCYVLISSSSIHGPALLYAVLACGFVKSVSSPKIRHVFLFRWNAINGFVALLYNSLC